VYAVDTWKGCPDDVSTVLATNRDIHAQWKTNVKALTAGNVIERRMDWRDYVAGPQGGVPVALVFIDAEHTYDEVHDAIEAFLPLMSPGGVICGDDAHHPPVVQAVVDTLGSRNVRIEATLWMWRKPL
jgi:predicted O-methyltransferase YrrM